jgi:hypothetical protein
MKKETNTTTKADRVCNFCGNGYNQKETVRIYGDGISGFCSAQCYTKFLTDKPLTATKGELLQTSFETLHIGLDSPENGERWQIINQDGEHILYIESYPLRENAIAICQAVNERQKLLDSNKKLLDALEQANKMMWDLRHSYCEDEEGYLRDDAQGWDAEIDILVSETINNAKNIQP